jgi:hypothetical protein
MIDEVTEVGVMLVLHVNAQMSRACKNGFAFLAHEALVDSCHCGSGGSFLTVDPLLVSTEMIVACKVFRAVCAVIRLQL